MTHTLEVHSAEEIARGNVLFDKARRRQQVARFFFGKDIPDFVSSLLSVRLNERDLKAMGVAADVLIDDFLREATPETEHPV
jgi:hypothetical protein